MKILFFLTFLLLVSCQKSTSDVKNSSSDAVEADCEDKAKSAKMAKELIEGKEEKKDLFSNEDGGCTLE